MPRIPTTLLTSALLLGVAPLLGPSLSPAAAAAEDGCVVSGGARPQCPAGTALEVAAFLDPTARVTGAGEVQLGEQVYVGPFARLATSRRAGIAVGPESNVQDNVSVTADPSRSTAERRLQSAAGLRRRDGVRTGERVILAHGSSVRGPALLGVPGPGQDLPAERDSGIFISFGAQVDGAILERDSGLSALSRIGPGVRLRSGFLVLPGKDVRSQREADDPALGKVRPIVEADRLFNAGVVEVNVGLAREYTRLFREDASAVRGMNVDPGGNTFDRARDAPTVESDLCTGPEARRPGFRNRIIGDACFEDSVEQLDAAMGERISIRADEGGPFGVGSIEAMGDGTIFHALEGTDLRVGDRVTYGKGVIVHGGGRPAVDPTTGVTAPTVIGNDVTLGNGSTVFRSLVRNGAQVGDRSAVVGSELRVGQRIPARTIFANDEVFGRVEW